MLPDQSLLPGALASPRAAEALVECGARYGLRLTRAQALTLAGAQRRALRDCGRVDFGGDIPEKLIAAFADSPYLETACAETLAELVELFYAAKNETRDRLSDDEVIAWMRDRFNGVCHGAPELLRDRELYALARDLNDGKGREKADG